MKLFEKIKQKEATNKRTKVKLFGISIYKRKKVLDKTKIKFLGMPLIKLKTKRLWPDTMKTKVYMLGMPVIKIVKNSLIKKVYFAEIQILRIKYLLNKQKIYFLGIPVLKIKYNNNRKKIYIFSVKIFTSKILSDANVEILDKLKSPKSIKFPKSAKPLVSIIIPVYNQYEYTMNCLYSIIKSEDKTSYEIILADDCSTDETKKIEKKVKNIKVIHNKKNLGYIRNVNNAAKFAKGKYVYFLNNDTIVQKHWLQEMVKVFAMHPNVGVVGSKIIKADGNLQECGVLMFADFFSCHRSSNVFAHENMYVKKCDYVSGCSLLTPKKLFEQIGGFDEIYAPAYSDDPDYCLAAKDLGYDTVVQPKSMIVHYGSLSYEKKSNELQVRNNKLLRQKWHKFFASRTKFLSNKEFSGKKRETTILVVDDFYPQFDKHAGGKTIFQFLQVFVKMGLSVKFCPLFAANCEEPYYSILTDMGIDVLPNQGLHSWIEANTAFIDYILLSRPGVAKEFMIKSLQARGIKIIYYGHDLHHLRKQREAVYNKNDASIAAEIEYVKNIESCAIEFSDIALYPSIEEKKYIETKFGFHNVNVITPYMYDTNKMTVHNSFTKSNGIVFVGSSHGPNLDGLLWFIKNIFPAVLKKIPHIKLYIVGSSVADEIKALKSKNIEIVGYLTEEELNKMYSTVKLSIAPLRYGAGIKGKIIDSIYHSTPVITTAIGAEGIADKYGLVTAAQTEKDFADKLIELYTKKEKWNSLKPYYAKFIEEYYSFEKAGKTFKKFIKVIDRENDKF